MGDDVRLIDGFIPAMDANKYWDWQHSYFFDAGEMKRSTYDVKPDIEWVRVGDIQGRVSVVDIIDDGTLTNGIPSVRHPGKTLQFSVYRAGSPMCSDDPEVWALLEKLGIKPNEPE